jgi:large subunit ribosomal protein L21
MYAIVEIAGQQFKVEKDQQIFVHRLDTKEGSKVDFDKVLLMDNAGKVNVGAPVIKGAKVTAKVLEHLKGDKVIVFKKKRRKGYKVKNGHRQYLTKLEILKIDDKAPAAKKPSAKKEVKPVAEKVSSKKTAAKKPAAKKLAAKKAPAKKTAAKKPAAKKAPEKKKTTAKKAE